MSSSPSHRPKRATIFFVLTLSQLAFALWDVISREVFDRHVHPFLAPLPFFCIRTFMAACLNVLLALFAEGLTLRRPELAVSSSSSSDTTTTTTNNNLNPTTTSKTPPKWKLWLALHLLSFLGLTVSRVLYRTGIQLTTSTHAAAFQPLVAPATTVIFLILGLETTSARVVLVPLLALFGSILIVIGSGHHEPTRRVITTVDQAYDVVELIESSTYFSATAVGSFLLGVQVFGFAVFFVLQRHLLQYYKPVWLSALTFSIGLPQITLVTYISSKFWSYTSRQDIHIHATVNDSKKSCCCFEFASLLMFFLLCSYCLSCEGVVG